MRILYSLTVATLTLLVSFTARAETLAGPITNASNGHLYYLLTNNSWTASEAEAVSLGGHLVTVNDSAENLWVMNTFMPLTGVPYASLWIGLNDAASEGQFVWASGEPVTFTYWYPGEPNNAGDGEDYATIRHPSESPPIGSWNDLSDNSGLVTLYPIFGVVEVAPRPAGTLAGPITNAVNGHIYYLLTNNSWTASEAKAVSLGGHLVTINDSAENQWVMNTFMPLTGVPYASLWIGLNDAASEGHFVWASGERVEFTYWYPGEPNNAGGGEDYATIRHPSESPPVGSWNDLSDDSGLVTPYPIFGVVEVDPTPKLTIDVASVAIKWYSATNSVYQLQYRSSLTTNSWVNLGMPISGTGSNIVVLDSVLNDPRRLYRLQLVP